MGSGVGSDEGAGATEEDAGVEVEDALEEGEGVGLLPQAASDEVMRITDNRAATVLVTLFIVSLLLKFIVQLLEPLKTP